MTEMKMKMMTVELLFLGTRLSIKSLNVFPVKVKGQS